MAAIRNEIRFILNDQSIALDDVNSSDMLLDYLRLDKNLTGTKEGCAEGDCGACTVLVGRLTNGVLNYQSVNTCICFTGSLDGCHVVTVEHMKRADGSLHPVQQAMVDNHGSQCGFCTPGFVMSLYGLWMENAKPSVAEIESALQGNLCRCTGYEPIVKAALAVSQYGDASNDPMVQERAEITRRLLVLSDDKRVDISTGDDQIFVPADLDDLAEIVSNYPNATIVAGATDVGLWVTKFMRSVSPAVFVSHLDELKTIEIDDKGVTLGAGVSYTEFFAVVRQHFPQMVELWDRIGGMQVRNMGTIGGNLANGSPIGDTPPPLIVLGATITLRKGKTRRSVLLEDFFIEYGKQDRQSGDFVDSIHIPFPEKNDLFAVYKITKRSDEDISAVCGAFSVRLKGTTINSASIAFGGMAATPKRASNVEKSLIGAEWSEQSIRNAMAKMSEDYTPLSDWRASADYRGKVAENLLLRFFLEHQGDTNVRLAVREVA